MAGGTSAPNENQLLPLISLHTHAHPEDSLIHLYSGAFIEIHAKLNLMSSCVHCCAHFTYILSACACVYFGMLSCRQRLSQYKNSVTIYRWQCRQQCMCVCGQQYHHHQYQRRGFAFLDVFAYLNLRITIGIYYSDVFI